MTAAIINKDTNGNLDTAALSHHLENVLQKVRILAEGLPKSSNLPASDVEKLRKSLLSIADDRCVTAKEAAKAEEVCNFMILPKMEECLNLWFGKSAETDAKIWADFAEDVTKASTGMYEHWSYSVDHPRCIVALVIYLDQFRRNMFRGTKGMYACDKMCAGYVKRAMQAGIHEKLTPKEMIFMLLVLTHSEDVEDQYLCFSEYEKLEKTLDKDDPLQVFREIFKRHVDVIEKYGRFPHRNSIYGRTNTPEEDEFLLDSSFRFDLPVKKTSNGGFAFFRDGKVLWKTARTSFKNSRRPSLLKVVEDACKKEYAELYDIEGTHKSKANDKFYFDDPDAHAAAVEQQKFLRIGDTAPDFIAKSTEGIIRFHEYLGDSWGIIFSHPKDFTPVCTTELGRAAQLQEEFTKRNVKMLAVSVDLLKDHQKWMDDIKETSGATVQYPLIEDKHRKISSLYGMLDQSSKELSGSISITIRSVFVINPNKKVVLILSYPVPVGRNFTEILRAIDALQTNYKYSVATPVDWERGKPTIVLPFYSDLEAEAKFGNIEKKTDYLRFTPDPAALDSTKKE